MTGRNKVVFHSGFTLIELMVTIAIAAILVTAGVPAFNQFVKGNRAATQVNSLIGALNIARSEAITRKVTVTVRPGTVSSDGTVTNATGWSNGWIVFVDQGTSGEYDSGDELLDVFAKLDGGNTFKTSLTAISYGSTGLGSTSGALTLCDDSNDYLQGVVITATGAARASDKDNNGNALSCT